MFDPYIDKHQFSLSCIKSKGALIDNLSYSCVTLACLDRNFSVISYIHVATMYDMSLFFIEAANERRCSDCADVLADVRRCSQTT